MKLSNEQEEPEEPHQGSATESTIRNFGRIACLNIRYQRYRELALLLLSSHSSVLESMMLSGTACFGLLVIMKLVIVDGVV